MRNFRTILFLLVISMPGALSAQSWPFELWHEGKIVLAEGDTLRGLVKYDMQQDIVQYALKDKTGEAYSARKVLWFEIFDESVRRYRRFFTLPFENATGYAAPVFFELLEEGKLTLLARESLEVKTFNSPYYFGSVSRQVLVNHFFFLSEDGDIKEFRGKKNDLIDLMGKDGKAVDKYIRTNRLRVEEKYDMAKIVGYYNTLGGS